MAVTCQVPQEENAETELSVQDSYLEVILGSISMEGGGKIRNGHKEMLTIDAISMEASANSGKLQSWNVKLQTCPELRR